jgi:prevent-host-death family protein
VTGLNTGLLAESSDNHYSSAMRTVSAADANRHFSKILGEVKKGQTIVVTSHGEPVAKIGPASEDDAHELGRERARQDLIAHLRAVQSLNIPITWKRDDLYEDDV